MDNKPATMEMRNNYPTLPLLEKNLPYPTEEGGEGLPLSYMDTPWVNRDVTIGLKSETKWPHKILYFLTIASNLVAYQLYLINVQVVFYSSF